MTRRAERLTALVVAGALAFNYPLLELFDRATLLLGVPTTYLYLFSAWAAFIVLVALALTGRDGPRDPGEDGR